MYFWNIQPTKFRLSKKGSKQKICFHPFFPLCIITHRIISSGFHWIKLIMWYKFTWYKMVIRGYLPSNLISIIWFYCFDRRKTKKKANVQANLLIIIGQEPKKTFCRSQWRINKKNGLQLPTEKHEKIYKICRKDLCVFALRNYSEGYKTNKLISSFLVYHRIMPLAERLSSKKASFFAQSLSLGHYPSIYQSPKGVYLPNVYSTDVKTALKFSWIEQKCLIPKKHTPMSWGIQVPACTSISDIQRVVISDWEWNGGKNPHYWVWKPNPRFHLIPTYLKSSFS